MISTRQNRKNKVGEVAGFEFFEVDGFGGYDKLYKFSIAGEEPGSFCWESLERAIVEAIGQKYTGKIGAMGTGVDTAGGWFMKMIGANKEA